MPSIHFEKRDYCYSFGCSNSTWTWARWILFVLFILGLILLVLSAIRINKRRGQEGRQPIRGTAWITPPSYNQSQQQTQNPPYVPQYTEQTNDNDMGYYDAQGVFHANPKAREAYHLNNLVPDQTGTTNGASASNNYQYQPPVGPPPGVATANHTGYDENRDFERDFSRYYGNTTPQVRTTNDATNSANQATTSSSDDVEYQRPDVPPPAHKKG